MNTPPHDLMKGYDPEKHELIDRVPYIPTRTWRRAAHQAMQVRANYPEEVRAQMRIARRGKKQ